MKNIVILPDIHGRDFWKDAVYGHENDRIVFLGDYFDPYAHEGLSEKDTIDIFREIIAFRDSHPENVTMLLGNHDCGYLWNGLVCSSRRSHRHYQEIRRHLEANFEFFNLAYSATLGDRQYLFSHSGVHKKWLDLVFTDRQDEFNGNAHAIANALNGLLHGENPYKELYLLIYSYFRGWGCRSDFGSCVWADVREWDKGENNIEYNKKLGVYQIFGHTQLEDEPVIEDDYACLDVRRGFVLTEDNGIIDCFRHN